MKRTFAIVYSNINEIGEHTPIVLFGFNRCLTSEEYYSHALFFIEDITDYTSEQLMGIVSSEHLTKKIYSIEYPDICGPMWINKDALLLCLTTQAYVDVGNTLLTIEDITDSLCTITCKNIDIGVAFHLSDEHEYKFISI